MCCFEVDLESCWEMVMEGGCVKNGCVIVEEFILFELEIMFLIVCVVNGMIFCELIGYV